MIQSPQKPGDASSSHTCFCNTQNDGSPGTGATSLGKSLRVCSNGSSGWHAFAAFRSFDARQVVDWPRKHGTQLSPGSDFHPPAPWTLEQWMEMDGVSCYA